MTEEIMTLPAGAMGRINPPLHYWLADDDRVYSGPTQSIITAADPTYAAWAAAGNVAVRWPVDEAGAQTDAILAETIAPHGLSITPALALMRYSAERRFAKEVEGIDFNGKKVSTDRETQSRVTVALAYAQQEPDGVIQWKTKDGEFVELDLQDIASLAKSIGAHVEDLWAKEAAVAKKISSGAITTKKQIDAEF
jgi:hypothetical protein